MFFVFFIAIFLFIFILSIKIDKNNNMDINHTNRVKGCMAILLLIHHLSLAMNDLPIYLTPLRYIAFIIVGLFFFYSGYGLMVGLMNKENYMKKFLSKRLVKIVIPYLLCCFIFGIYFIICNEYSLKEYIVGIISTNLIAPLWFFNVIFIIYILFWLIFKFTSPKKGINIFLLITLLYIILGIIFNFYSHWCSSIIGFSFGLYYAQYKSKIDTLIKGRCKLVLLISIFIVLFCARLIISMKFVSYEFIHIPYRNILTILFILCIIALSNTFKIKGEIFNKLGIISYEIYLVHPFVIKAFNNISFYNFSSIYILILTLLISYFIYISGKKLTRISRKERGAT